MVLRTVILSISALTVVSGWNYMGGTMSIHPRQTDFNGSYEVEVKYKRAFDYTYIDYGSVYCDHCFFTYYQTEYGIEPLDNSSGNIFHPSWYQTESYSVFVVHTDKDFYFRTESCCWYSNGWWYLPSKVDLGKRSDNNRPNSSPVTTTIPVLRVPYNCPGLIKLIAHDRDGDIVRCRYATSYWWDCANCYHQPGFTLDQDTCTLSYPEWWFYGMYIFEIMLEDFPKENIHLAYNDGTFRYKYRPYFHKNREAAKESDRYRWYVSTESYSSSVTATETEAITDVSHTSSSLVTDVPYTGIQETATEDLANTITRDMFTGITEAVTMQTITEGTRETTTPYSWQSQSMEAVTMQTITEGTRETTTPYSWQSQSTLPPLEPLSSIPLQFILYATDAVPSCAEGQWIPKFLPPTPRQGEKLYAKAGSAFRIRLSAYALYDSVLDFKISGPPGMSKGEICETLPLNTTHMVLEWTPREKDVGNPFPICFVGETHSGYHSEMRCIIIVVGPSSLGMTTLICYENTMTLIIEKTRDTELYEGHLHMIDPNCLVTTNYTHLIASVEYNSCGTEIEETEEDIIFSNRITSFDSMESVITRKNHMVIPMNCSFPKESRISTSFRAHRADYEFIEAGFGHFNYTFHFYTNDQFVEELNQYPLEVSLRDLLYLGIEASSAIPNVELFVESCRATPHDNPNDPVFYDIIRNGCLTDDTVVPYSRLPTQLRISMEAFAFIGYHEEVYIGCTVMLCKVGGNTRCSQGCINRSMGEKHRRKRSVGSESQQHSISQGPLRLKRPSEHNSDDENPPALNVNTLVIGVSGVVIVALVAFIVYMMVPKSTKSSYEKL